jgi:hypothetical protein
MSRKSRSQRQRSARRSAERDDAAVQPSTSARTRVGRSNDADPMAVYRGLAAPSLRMRWILVGGLACFTAAQVIALAEGRSVAVAGDLAFLGLLCILVFLGGGFIRHQRALYRIRRDSPEAWQPTMRFAFASLAVPLGFSGPPADRRERNVRSLTLLLLLAFAVTAVAGSYTVKH